MTDDERERHESLLRGVSQTCEAVEEALSQLYDERNRAIRKASAAGFTQAEIAQCMNLTRARVGQIVGEK